MASVPLQVQMKLDLRLKLITTVSTNTIEDPPQQLIQAELTTETTEGTFEPKHEVSRVNVVGRVGEGLAPKLGGLGIFV